MNMDIFCVDACVNVNFVAQGISVSIVTSYGVDY